uniref:tRNA (guanine(9)-N(1))-methyltransferase n=1 Tax=Globodera rostochiensis TaxID=31243 RepID=A0A914HDX8_GLORO
MVVVGTDDASDDDVEQCTAGGDVDNVGQCMGGGDVDDVEQCTAGGDVQQQQDAQHMSKSQRKKHERMERYAARRKELRRAHRERRKERKRTAVCEASGPPPMAVERLKLYPMNTSECAIRVVVDMAYDELMDERTVKKTMSQLAHCYAANRRSPNPLQFFVVNLDGKGRKRQPLNKLWPVDEIVYLTADSDNVLTELDVEKVYVIGGLLDHNHHKGLCMRRAVANGFAHAKLPIGDFVRMSSRKVLTINHVFEILLHFTREHDWERAFLGVIPKRKGPELIDSNTTATEQIGAGLGEGEEDTGRPSADRISTNEAEQDEEMEQEQDGCSGQQLHQQQHNGDHQSSTADAGHTG